MSARSTAKRDLVMLTSRLHLRVRPWVTVTMMVVSAAVAYVLGVALAPYGTLGTIEGSSKARWGVAIMAPLFWLVGAWLIVRSARRDSSAGSSSSDHDDT